MADIITFNNKTVENVLKEIKDCENKLKNFCTYNEFTELKKSINDTQSKRNKTLNLRKTKKFNQLKYHPERSHQKANQVTQQSQQNNNLSYAGAVRSKSRPNNATKRIRSKSNNTRQNLQSTNRTPSQTNEINRKNQIDKLQKQIDELRNNSQQPNSNQHHSKNGTAAPQRGAQNPANEVTPTDVLDFISTAIGRLNEFAELFKTKGSTPQTRQGMW